MSQTSIRLVKTPEVDQVIRFLRDRFTPLSEPEILKLALSEMYNKEQRMIADKLLAVSQKAGKTPTSLTTLQNEAQKSGANTLTEEEIEKEIAAVRAAPKNKYGSSGSI